MVSYFIRLFWLNHMKKNLSQKRRQDEILKKNPRIDLKLVRHQEELERELEKFGVDIKPKFRIEPPLGGTKLRLFNQD